MLSTRSQSLETPERPQSTHLPSASMQKKKRKRYLETHTFQQAPPGGVPSIYGYQGYPYHVQPYAHMYPDSYYYYQPYQTTFPSSLSWNSNQRNRSFPPKLKTTTSISYDSEESGQSPNPATSVEEKSTSGVSIEPISLNDFCVEVGRLAMSLPVGSNRRVSLKNLDWGKVSKRFPSLSAAQCKDLWFKEYKNHYFERIEHGIVLTCGSLCGNSLNNDHHHTVTQDSSDQYEPMYNIQTNSNNYTNTGTGTTCSNSGSSNDSRKRLKRVKLTEREELMVREMQKKYGNKWTFIADRMGTGRTGVEIKNYWHNLRHKLALKLFKEQQRKADNF